MRLAVTLGLMLGLLGCATTEVQRLDLRDPRLPGEARRWLADAEDEVVIARASMRDRRARLAALELYREEMMARIAEGWSHKKAGAPAEGKAAAKLFERYLDERIALAELELGAAGKVYELATTRLTQARAETAVRYDLAVYEIGPIAHEVEVLRGQVAAGQQEVEAQRVLVEETADEVWKAFAHYVGKGGTTSAMWSSVP